MSKKQALGQNSGQSALTMIEQYIIRRDANPGYQEGIGSAEDFYLRLRSVVTECAKFGIDTDLIVDACDPTPESTGQANYDCPIDILSLRLLREYVAKGNLKLQGHGQMVRGHNQIPNSLVSELTALMIQACNDIGQEPPQALSILVRVQLGRLDRLQSEPRQGQEKDMAALLMAADGNLSSRRIAEAVGVDHTTIQRWRQDPTFQNKIKKMPKISSPETLISALTK